MRAMKFTAITLLMGLTGGAEAAVMENLGRTGESYLYRVEGGQVIQEICVGAPSIDAEAAGCKALSQPSLALATFEAEVRAAAKSELDKSAALRAEQEAKAQDLRAQLTHVEQKIATLELETPPPTILKDYQNRRDDLREALVQAERRVAEIDAELASADELFSADGLLAEELVHPVDGKRPGYEAIRPYVRQFHHVFARHVGTRHGANTWYDVATGRVWYAPPGYYGPFTQVGNSCPRGYGLLNPNEHGFWDAIERFNAALIHGETGMTSGLLQVWGVRLPDVRCTPFDFVRTGRPCPGPQAYIVSPFGLDDYAPRARASSLDIVNVELLCVSQGPVR